ncbi:MAG: FAD-binding oxidoreductase [Solirubrobacterales bacterium]
MNALGKDLANLIDSIRVKTDPEDLMAYASDALHYYHPHRPDAVVLPRSTDEVSRILRYASLHQIPVTPRGAGSGLSGAATPSHGGIVLDMKQMSRILEIDRKNMTATVEPGAVTGRFHHAVEKLNMFYPPDPQSMTVCTIGGNVATRAGGPRGVKYGTTGNYVTGLDVVLPDGSIIRTGGKFVKQSVGYDLTHLMTGSEGTLGVITGVTLRLLPLPATNRTVFVTCETLDQAAEIVSEVIARGSVPAMLEFLMNLAVMVMNNYITPPAAVDAGAYLLIEFDGDETQVAADCRRIEEVCYEMKAREVRVIENEAEAASYWTARSKLYPLINTIYKRAVSEDVTVPRSRIPDFVRAIQQISAEVGVGIGIAGHAGDGNIHPTILCNELGPEMDAKTNAAIARIIRDGLRLGGTISGEHGIGLHKAEFLAEEMDAATISLMRRIKQAFDPLGIMNPGKIWMEEGAKHAAS